MFTKTNSLFLFLLSLFGIQPLLYAQEKTTQTPDSMFVTVYNENLGVIRDIRTFPFSPGIFKLEITDIATQILPTTVSFNLSGTILEQNYQYDLVSIDKILKKYINEEIQLISEKGELIEGKVLYATSSQVVLSKKNGGLIMIPNIGSYRIFGNVLPDGLITKPTLVCLVNTKASGKQPVEMSYQTSGMGWNAEYVAVLNENDTKLDLNAWVSINNSSGASYKNAKIKLVAGDINRADDDMRIDAVYEKSSRDMAAGSQFEEKSFYEYHLYTLERPSDLMNNETKQISLFSGNDISILKKYHFSSGYYGAGEKKVAVVLEFANKSENNLGVPMPKGKIRLYKSDGTSIEFIGEDKIDHTPKNEIITIKTGDAFDVTAEEIISSQDKITDRIVEYTYKVTVKNQKDSDIEVEVEKVLGGFWNIKKSNIKHEKINASTARFIVPVKAGKETTLEYVVRIEY